MSDAASTDCLFCRIVEGTVPADIVHTDEHTVSFRDIAPQAPTHVLVIPRRHAPNAAAVAEEAGEAGSGGVDALVRAAAAVAGAEGLGGDYRLVFNTGAGAGQTVFHAHLHVLGGRPLSWPPG